jgi:hypothetical protein
MLNDDREAVITRKEDSTAGTVMRMVADFE